VFAQISAAALNHEFVPDKLIVRHSGAGRNPARTYIPRSGQSRTSAAILVTYTKRISGLPRPAPLSSRLKALLAMTALPVTARRRSRRGSPAAQRHTKRKPSGLPRPCGPRN